MPKPLPPLDERYPIGKRFPLWMTVNIFSCSRSSLSNHCRKGDHQHFREWSKAYGKGEWDFEVVGTHYNGQPKYFFFRVSDSVQRAPLVIHPKRVDDINLDQRQFAVLAGCTIGQLRRRVLHDDHIGFRSWSKRQLGETWDYEVVGRAKGFGFIRVYFRVE